MVNVAIKSENLSPFGGIFSIIYYCCPIKLFEPGIQNQGWYLFVSTYNIHEKSGKVNGYAPFFSRFQAYFQLKSGWIEPLRVGGHAPFSPFLLNFFFIGMKIYMNHKPVPVRIDSTKSFH